MIKKTPRETCFHVVAATQKASDHNKTHGFSQCCLADVVGYLAQKDHGVRKKAHPIFVCCTVDSKFLRIFEGRGRAVGEVKGNKSSMCDVMQESAVAVQALCEARGRIHCRWDMQDLGANLALSSHIYTGLCRVKTRSSESSPVTFHVCSPLISHQVA